MGTGTHMGPSDLDPSKALRQPKICPSRTPEPLGRDSQDTWCCPYIYSRAANYSYQTIYLATASEQLLLYLLFL